MTALDTAAAGFRESAFPLAVLADAIGPDERASLRNRLAEHPGQQVFSVADRGHYRLWPGYREPALCARLSELAAHIVGAPLAPHEQRWACFGHRDYALVRDDDQRRPALAAWVEVILDLSTAATGAAEVVYSGPDGAVALPQIPGLLAVVGRSGETRRYERYLSHQVGRARVHRLTLVLRPSDA